MCIKPKFILQIRINCTSHYFCLNRGVQLNAGKRMQLSILEASSNVPEALKRYERRKASLKRR